MAEPRYTVSLALSPREYELLAEMSHSSRLSKNAILRLALQCYMEAQQKEAGE